MVLRPARLWLEPFSDRLKIAPQLIPLKNSLVSGLIFVIIYNHYLISPRAEGQKVLAWSCSCAVLHGPLILSS